VAEHAEDFLEVVGGLVPVRLVLGGEAGTFAVVLLLREVLSDEVETGVLRPLLAPLALGSHVFSQLALCGLTPAPLPLLHRIHAIL
jgi:hypothetical protein